MTTSYPTSQTATKIVSAGTSRGSRSRERFANQMARAMEAQARIEVGQRLKELRGRRTQQPVADYVGVTLRAYQRWEAGHASVSWGHLGKLAQYFNVTENYLLYGADEDPAHQAGQLDRIETMLAELNDRVERLDETLRLATAEQTANEAATLERTAPSPAPTRHPQTVPRQ